MKPSAWGFHFLFGLFCVVKWIFYLKTKKSPWNKDFSLYQPFGHYMAPRAGLEPATTRLTAACSANWAKEEYLSRDSFRNLCCVGIYLSSRHVAMQVLSARQSLTSVFGMGTGGPSASITPTFFAQALPCVMHLQGFEPGTHWLRVSCSTNWAKGA